MRIKHSGRRTFLPATCSLLLSAATLLGSASASAQNQIPDFLDSLSDPDVRSSNLGESALAIQRTCGSIAALGGGAGVPLFTPGSSERELWLRCNELVVTADELAGNGTGARTLGYTDSNELLAAFQQVNGEEAQASATMASTASSDQFSSIAARLGALRGATSASITSASANASEFMFGYGGGAAADQAGLPFGPWGWFFRGTYATGERDPSNPTGFTGEENGFDFDQYGFTFGIDHSSISTVWGIALSYSSYELEMDNRDTTNRTDAVSGGKIEADSVNGSFYFDYSGDNSVYFSVLSGYGTQSFDMARNFIYFSANTDPVTNEVVDQSRSLVATPDGDAIAASMTLGRMIQRGGFVIDPRIALTFDRITIDRFTEVDSGNSGGPAAMQLFFSEQKIDSIRANLGIQFSNNVNTSFGSVRPTFSVDWYHELEDDPRVIKVKYALEETLAGQGAFVAGFDDPLCRSCFDLRSEAPDSDFFVIGAGVAASYRNGFQTFLMLEGLLGYENLSAYSITVGLRGQF